MESVGCCQLRCSFGKRNARKNGDCHGVWCGVLIFRRCSRLCGISGHIGAAYPEILLKVRKRAAAPVSDWSDDPLHAQDVLATNKITEAQMQIFPLRNIPMITRDSDLAAEIAQALARASLAFEPGDILVLVQKIVSKAEGRQRKISDFQPSEQAIELARKVRKEPAYVEAVLSESRSVLRAMPEVLITEHRLGHIMANSGIDQSNIEDGDHSVLLLPEDPDRSARELRDRLCPDPSQKLGVIISDSFGRPWRIGTTGVAIGICGVPAVIDRRGDTDLFGRTLQATEIGFADSVAAAAVLAMGETDEGIPAALVRGLDWSESTQGAADGLREASKDMFR